MAETAKSGTDATALSAYYVRGEELLAVMRSGVAAGIWKSCFYHADGLGSIRALTEESGTATDRYEFTAFGELLGHTGKDPNVFLFVSEMLDPNSGLYYNRARWLDPEMGRFASVDPFLGSQSDPSTLHRYTYAGLNPVDRIDPTGREFTLGGTVSALRIGTAVAAIALGYLYLSIQQQSITDFFAVDAIYLDYSRLSSDMTPSLGFLFSEFRGRIPEDVQWRIASLATQRLKEIMSPYGTQVTTNPADIKMRFSQRQIIFSEGWIESEEAGIYPAIGARAWVFLDRLVATSQGDPTETKIQSIAMLMANVAAHEFGHSVGLLHENIDETVMGQHADESNLDFSSAHRAILHRILGSRK